MKPRDRSINIFSISFLDVISGALGAFLIVMIVLLPYYRKEHIDYQSEIQRLSAALDEAQQEAAASRRAADEARAQLAAAEQRAAAAEQRAAAAEAQLVQAQAEAAAAGDAQARLQAAEDRARQAEARAQNAEARLRRTFLVVYISWSTTQDVDLHVVDPTGARFNWEVRRVAGRPGELSEDNVNGPGNEVWEVRDAEPGEYLVYANLYNRRGDRSNPAIRGRVFHRDGSEELQTVTLTQESGSGTPNLVQMARIVIDAAGNVRLR